MKEVVWESLQTISYNITKTRIQSNAYRSQDLTSYYQRTDTRTAENLAYMHKRYHQKGKYESMRHSCEWFYQK